MRHTQSDTRSLSVAERRALGALRERYQQDRDQFDAAELERLRFLRWLRQTGRLDHDVSPPFIANEVIAPTRSALTRSPQSKP
jgi:hypothetical protein